MRVENYDRRKTFEGCFGGWKWMGVGARITTFSPVVLTVIFFYDVAGIAFRVALEFVETKIRQLYDPSRIHQAVRRAQRSVVLYDRLVQIDHALKDSIQFSPRKSAVINVPMRRLGHKDGRCRRIYNATRCSLIYIAPPRPVFIYSLLQTCLIRAIHINRVPQIESAVRKLSRDGATNGFREST